MVIDFLKKYQEELISAKIELKEDMDLLETKINENKKFIELLESSNDSFFTMFTPRNVNEKNNEKAAEIKKDLSVLESDYQIKLEQMKAFDGRLSEVSSLISGTNTSNAYKELSISSKEAEDSTTKSIEPEENMLIEKLNIIKSYVILDPQRAVLELDSLMESLK